MARECPSDANDGGGYKRQKLNDGGSKKKEDGSSMSSGWGAVSAGLGTEEKKVEASGW